MVANGARQTQKSTEQIGQILRAFTLCGFRNDTHHKRRTTFVKMSLLRLKTRRSAFGTSDTQQIFFLHPGYPEGHNLLLSLPAFDSRGIHHETARIACAILANSRWDGFLSLTKDGAAVADERDDVLLNTRYYFRIPDDDQYPVVPSYENFRCPTTLPESWAAGCPHIEPTATDDVGRRDQTCRATASTLANEIAHIIPQALSEWWQRNSMFTYTANPDLSSDTRCADNAILLRRDLHKLWDDHRFAFVPKQGYLIGHLPFMALMEDVWFKTQVPDVNPQISTANLTSHSRW
ncbi:hypothetical protein V2A60_008042 [Cordyceps javanica]